MSLPLITLLNWSLRKFSERKLQHKQWVRAEATKNVQYLEGCVWPHSAQQLLDRCTYCEAAMGGPKKNKTQKMICILLLSPRETEWWTDRRTDLGWVFLLPCWPAFTRKPQKPPPGLTQPTAETGHGHTASLVPAQAGETGITHHAGPQIACQSWNPETR